MGKNLILLILLLIMFLIPQPRSVATLPDSLQFSEQLVENTELEWGLNVTIYSVEGRNVIFSYYLEVNILLIRDLAGVEYIDFQFPNQVSDYVVATENQTEIHPKKYFTFTGSFLEWLIVPIVSLTNNDSTNFFSQSATEGSDYFQQEYSEIDLEGENFLYLFQNNESLNIIDYKYDLSSGILISGISEIHDSSSTIEKSVFLKSLPRFDLLQDPINPIDGSLGQTDTKFDRKKPIFVLQFPFFYSLIALVFLIKRRIKY